MRTPSADILMITFNSADYVHISLPRLLESCSEHDRVWLWHNGADTPTLEATRSYKDHPRVHRFHHSPENVGLGPPTNWVWSEGDGDFVSKVDDDCLLPLDWLTKLRAAHEACPEFGAIGACRLLPEDVDQRLIERKMQTHNGIKIVRNHWVQGSGYLLKRSVMERQGPLDQDIGWTNYCLELARSGAVNGFLYPLIFEDHMDDPRSGNTLMRSDADLAWRMPLSMKRSNVKTLDDWQRRLVKSARELQEAPVDIRAFSGWRLRIHNLRQRLRSHLRP